MRIRGWLWALALVGMAIFTGWQLASGNAIQTDLLDMLPDTERNPLAEQAIKSLAKTTGERAVFLVHADSPARTKAAVLTMADSLHKSGAFQDVTATLPPIDPGMVGRFYTPFAWRVAPPSADLAASPESLRARIESRLVSPQGSFSSLGAGVDPLGSLDDFLSSLPLMSSRLTVEDDLLVISSSSGPYVMFTGGLRGSAFDPDVQKRVIAATRSAEKELKNSFPGVEILKTGTVFYASDARESAETEVNLISTSSMLCICLLFFAVFRSLRHLLLGMLGVVAGFVAATAVCLLIYGKLYLLTIVCGSSVMGVSVDYTVHYFATHLGAGESWDPFAALKKILPGLWIGLLTTLLGYAALLVAPFPGLRQIAVFSIVGLIASFLTVLFLLPELLPRPMPPQPRFMRAQRWILDWGIKLSQMRGAQVALIALTLLLGLSLFKLRVDDAVQGLILPSRTLRAQESRISELTGLSNSGIFLLVEGADEAQVLAREEALLERLAKTPKTAEQEGFQAISTFVPSPARQEANLRRHRELAPQLPKALEASGFKPAIGKTLIEGLKASANQPLTVGAWLQTDFATPFRMLWLGATPKGAASVVFPMGAPDSRTLEQAVQGLPGVSLVDKARSVSGLLGQYRQIAIWALIGAIALVWILLAYAYGLRVGTVILLPSLGGILLALAGLALAGIPVTLFSTLALILVLGYGVDYPIFMREGGQEDPTYFVGVQVASLCTLISFGLLC
ncbi:MAG: MMPL family transporter, partial [Holophaga sp.]|nr:MMPL family transporter [Holophaga sp.]